ncbi:MAG TPA: YhbD family protein [Bacilli bacterium]|nr:YhbD family protein [Bacilli bacterium]
MGEDLISKKDLLELTGISYGQLYRWKRKNLIPEDWFIRKSTFTGQETFFPKAQILARIDKIVNMKEDLSLDELADMFSPAPTEVALTKQHLLERNIVSSFAVEQFLHEQRDEYILPFEQILAVFMVDRLLQSGDLSLDEGRHMLQTFQEHHPKFEGKPCDLIFLRKLGIAVFFMLSANGEVRFEQGVKVVARLNIAQCTEELKLKVL